MANPTVEKLKSLGLRHGEKAVIGLSVSLFLLFVVLAVARPGFEVRADDLKKKAEQADSNLNRPQTEDDILKKLVDLGVKPSTDFAATVADQQGRALNPADYIPRQAWITPEPGAGLIRDLPVLIAPTDLAAFPNRGGYTIIDTDDKGNRIVDDGKDASKKRPQRVPRRRTSGLGMMAGGGGYPGAAGGAGGGSQKQKDAAEARLKAEQDRLAKALVGKADAKKGEEKKKEDDDALAANVVYKETVRGLRSVVVTGVVDYKTLRENYLAALKDQAIAYPNFLPLGVQRQEKTGEGTWTEFADLDSKENFRILDNAADLDEELVPEDARLEALVDPLPFPRAGYWAKVHLASLVPEDRRQISRPGGPGGGDGGEMFGGGGGKGGVMGPSGAGGGPSGMVGGPGGNPMAGGSGRNRIAGMGDEAGMAGGMKGGGMALGGGGAAAPSGPVDDSNFQKSELDEVMIRSIDFTVQPEMTYRYRVRLVVVNPNRLRSDVSPGTDTESEELNGPWSEPSEEVTVPGDTAAYAMTMAPPTRRNDQVSFQIVRWNPEDGHTVTRNDEAGPGEMVGEPASADVPSSEGKGKTSKLVDFNSRRFVLDSIGGVEQPSPAVKQSAPFAIPAMALLIRPDGTVVVQSQAADTVDDVRIEAAETYAKALKDSSRRREPRGMGGYPGAAGGASR